ncbi:Dextranase [Penicillium rolfsii]|nr:Dextranase [Penicillium rolfsii]
MAYFLATAALAAVGARYLPSASKEKATACDSNLCTWWHDSGEINTATRVQPGNVRQSHRYNVQVRLAGTDDFRPSFVYETIPRNGNGRIYSPWDYPNDNTLGSDVDDGISIESEAGITMAWSQFEYAQDVDVKITRRDGQSLGPTSNVIIRPTSTSYSLSTSSDGGIVIRVPKDDSGRRFSVEFNDDLYTYRSDGQNYVQSGGEVVSIEPRNGLLIFASAFLPADKTPQMNSDNTKTMRPGPINAGDWGDKSILYFPPGVYWMNSNPQGDQPKYGENHIKLDPKTYWVHLAPGAYVKGAIEYTTANANFFATGHGVLSGEHYVYQANPATYYQGLKRDETSLRLWYHKKIGSQIWHCHGPTINAPPFNTMDFHGNSDQASVRISDYKQVGAFFMQTDGPQMYPNSVVHDVFYHANDDVIKAYYSHVVATGLTVWKVHNDPIIQMGWDSHQVSDVVIDGLYIIHTRYRRSETGVPSAIIGASPFYKDGKTPDTRKSSSLSISNVVCEGPSPSLFRIQALQNYENFRVKNVAYPDGLSKVSFGLGQSMVPYAPETKMDLQVENWTVRGQKVTMKNFQSDSLGQFNIAGEYWGQWSIE